ncbi:transposase [Nocardia amamiensis]|uniref:transposase n=1 Tax=Nocardia amamiensis TaxID=404578 RepID=UPI000834355A|nr:transposase [Nocardia amamiensis]
MPMGSPHVVRLTGRQRSELEAVTRKARGPQRQVLRARIVLAAADGMSNAGIAMTLGVCVDTVRKWRKRFCRNGIKGLTDLPRSGRPRAFAAGVLAEVKALACELPAWSGLPLARWSCPELAREAVTRGITDRISGAVYFGAVCTHCPLRAQCRTAAGGRTITIGAYEKYLATARARQLDPAWKADYRAARPKVERKIGHLMRRRHGGRRVRLRGQAKIGADFGLLAAAHNLARLAVLGIGYTTSGWTTAPRLRPPAPHADSPNRHGANRNDLTTATPVNASTDHPAKPGDTTAHHTPVRHQSPGREFARVASADWAYGFGSWVSSGRPRS